MTFSHNVKVYILHEDDEDICLVQPTIGAPAAATLMDYLIACGCGKIIAVGSCGVLAELPENAFIVPVRALRDEGASYKYLPAERYIELDEAPIVAIEATFESHNLPFVTCTTWTTDGFFRETQDMVKYRLEEGCSVVEMECA
ncbi:MAG: nucleoside phosphorylase, partial [Lachnospiraceae bacterium]|nr:nucleoside phosphorylase [Lachnospiraceae bacterium]